MTTPVQAAMDTVMSPTATETVGAWGFHLGAVTGQLDGVVVLFWAFAIFFGTLVWHLRSQDKLEGYPLEDPTRPERFGPAIGFPPPPPPKTFQLHAAEQGGVGSVTLPRPNTPPEAPARHLHLFPGSAFVPTGINPMREAIGPASYAWRSDAPLLLEGHEPQIQPLRRTNGKWIVQGGDADPRGLPVIGRDGATAGHIRDLWVDRGVKILRYLEVELTEGGYRLMPIYYADVSAKFRRVKTRAIYAEQFAAGPVLQDPDQVTAREEDLICAYFAGGALFADDVRSGRFNRSHPDADQRGRSGLVRLLKSRRHA